MFKGNSSISTKQKLIDHIHSQQNIGLSTKFVTIKGQAFCLKFLSNISNISLYTLKKVISDYDNGVRIYSHGNGGVLKQYSQTTFQNSYQNGHGSVGRVFPEDSSHKFRF